MPTTRPVMFFLVMILAAWISVSANAQIVVDLPGPVSAGGGSYTGRYGPLVAAAEALVLWFWIGQRRKRERIP